MSFISLRYSSSASTRVSVWFLPVSFEHDGQFQLNRCLKDVSEVSWEQVAAEEGRCCSWTWWKKSYNVGCVEYKKIELEFSLLLDSRERIHWLQVNCRKLNTVNLIADNHFYFGEILRFCGIPHICLKVKCICRQSIYIYIYFNKNINNLGLQSIYV